MSFHLRWPEAGAGRERPVNTLTFFLPSPQICCPSRWKASSSSRKRVKASRARPRRPSTPSSWSSGPSSTWVQLCSLCGSSCALYALVKHVSMTHIWFGDFLHSKGQRVALRAGARSPSFSKSFRLKSAITSWPSSQPKANLPNLNLWDMCRSCSLIRSKQAFICVAISVSPQQVPGWKLISVWSWRICSHFIAFHLYVRARLRVCTCVRAAACVRTFVCLCVQMLSL